MTQQIKVSQRYVNGLPEALSGINTQLSSVNTTTATLNANLVTETANRTAADDAIISTLNIINGDATVTGSFRKAIADVIGNAPAAFDTLKEIADYIAVNPSANIADAINSKVATVQAALTAEISARTTADSNLTNLINIEVATRTSDVNTLTGLVSTETTARTTAVNTLTTNINAVQADLVKETADRTTAVSSLTAAVSAETVARTTAVSALQTSISNNIQPLLDAETAARIAEDAAINAKLVIIDGDATVTGSFRKAIADVIGNAPAAFDTLKEIADYIAVNPSANIADAINSKVSAVQTALTAETSARTFYQTDVVEYYLPNIADVSNQTDYVIFTGVSQDLLNNPLVTFVTSKGYDIKDVYNYRTLRVTKSNGISYLIPVTGTVGGQWTADFTGLSTEISYTEIGGYMSTIAGSMIQYAPFWVDYQTLYNTI